MLVSYNWLKDYLGKDIPTAEVISELLTFHAFEIEGVETLAEDTIFDIKILPDRANDCLSQRGVAHEIATLINKNLIADPLKDESELIISNNFVIDIENSNDCSRFMLAHMMGVKVGPSPDWLKSRLEIIGQRSINNIVDATNYVMYSLGQPMHVYDADQFAQKDGKWNFVIRRANKGETVVLLPEKKDAPNREVTLKGEELLIVNGSNNQPIGLAGVKGGVLAGLHEKTTNIILEAANFNSTTIRKTAKSLNIITDASKRFENELSPTLPPYALRYISKLITDIAGGELVGVADNYLLPKSELPVLVRKNRVNKVLGLNLDEQAIENIFTRLGAKIAEKNNDAWKIVSPAERTDLMIEENYIDEIGRIYGLLNIESVPPKPLALENINVNYFYISKIKNLLVDLGFSEVMTSSFRSKDEVHLQNALASDKEYIRSSIIPAMQNALALNIQNVDILGLKDIRIFEIGSVFEKTDKGITESMVLTIGARTKKTTYTQADDKIVNEVISELNAKGIIFDAKSVNGVCEISLSKVISELPIPSKYEPIEYLPEITYKPFSSYPAIVRDVAMWIDATVSKDSVFSILEKTTGTFCQRITLFDEFSKDGRVSLAFRLVFQSFDKTLTDAEIEPYMEATYQAIKKAGFEAR